MADMQALIKELADWDRQSFPLGGGNLIDLLIEHGFVSAADAEQMYRAAMTEFGEPTEWHWPAAMQTSVGPDGPVKQVWAQRGPLTDDDQIPF